MIENRDSKATGRSAAGSRGTRGAGNRRLDVRIDPRRTAMTCCLILGIAATAAAVAPSIWSVSGLDGFAAGDPLGVSITDSGEVVLAPSVERVAVTEEPRTWALASAPDGSVFVAAGTDQHVYRVERDGSVEPHSGMSARGENSSSSKRNQSRIAPRPGTPSWPYSSRIRCAAGLRYSLTGIAGIGMVSVI